MAKTYKIGLWDWDGSLANTGAMWTEAFRAAYRHFGLSPTTEEIHAHFGDTRGHLKLGIKERHAAQFIRLVDQFGIDNATRVELYPDARECLTSFREMGGKNAIVSTSPRPPLEAAFEHLGVRDLFDTVVTIEDCGRDKAKPDPFPLQLALDRTGGQHDHAIMVGDTCHDLAAATNAGVHSMLMLHPRYHGHRDLTELEKHSPTYRCNSFTEAAPILLNGSRGISAQDLARPLR